MGIIDSIKGQLIDIIEWTSTDPETLSHRFERRENEIKMGAKLVVREGQAAIFVNEGKLTDVFTPGTYTLSTQNLPILSNLRGWMYGFNSPFKAEVYFINSITISNRKWGTPNPVMMRDKELGVVRLRAFGAYSYSVVDAGIFFKTAIGTLPEVQTGDLEIQLKANIVSAISDTLGEVQISAFDLAAQYFELGNLVEKGLSEKFAYYGLKVNQFIVENISLPPEVEGMIDKRSSMGVVGNLDQFMKFNIADKAGEAISQPGGLAGTMAGAGIGIALGSQIAGQMNLGGAASPPPLPTEAFFVAIAGQQQGPFNLVQLKQMAMELKLTRDSLVWKEGMAAWAAASGVSEITSVFSSLPPKLPS